MSINLQTEKGKNTQRINTKVFQATAGERERERRQGEPERQGQAAKDDALCVKGATPVRMAHKDIYVDI